MLTLYIIAAIVGGILILTSVFLGVEKDIHHDINHVGEMDHADHFANHHEHEQAWIPFLSLRFWIYFSAAFGLIGILLDTFKMTHETVTLVWALIGGISSGLLVSWLLRAIRKGEAHSGARTQDLLGVEGIVLVRLNPTIPGKIRCRIRDEMIDLLAISNQNEQIETGESVVVLSIEGHFVKVARRKEILE